MGAKLQVKWIAAAVAAAAALAAILIVVLAGGRHPRSVSATPKEFGANVNLLYNGHTLGGAQIDAQLAALRATGATIARSDASWEVSEPSPPTAGVHHYEWSFDDEIAASLAAHGLRWLPIIDYSASWARSIPGQDHSAPNSDADYAAYGAAVAGRYGVGGAFWRQHPRLPYLPVEALEIWNEPDNADFWVPTPDPAGYARLYVAALDAIHAADPEARVLVGGLSNPPFFLPALVAADPAIKGQVDGVAIHPYAATPSAVLARVAQARRALDGLGLADVPLYVTEFGWTTGPPGTLDFSPARLRPGYIEATLESLARSGCGVSGALLYTWFAPGGGPAARQHSFGISGSSADVASFTAGVRAAQQAPGRSAACP